METKQDYSYGVIPLFKENGIWKIFLINQYGKGGDVYWTFPKGHAENGEEPEEAALRELHEETALTVTGIDTSRTYTQEYTFIDEGVQIQKTVIYYCGVVTAKEYRIQEEEVQEAGWFTLEEAVQKLTFEPAKRMLVEVINDHTA